MKQAGRRVSKIRLGSICPDGWRAVNGQSRAGASPPRPYRAPPPQLVCSPQRPARARHRPRRLSRRRRSRRTSTVRIRDVAVSTAEYGFESIARANRRSSGVRTTAMAQTLSMPPRGPFTSPTQTSILPISGANGPTEKRSRRSAYALSASDNSRWRLRTVTFMSTAPILWLQATWMCSHVLVIEISRHAIASSGNA